MDPELAAKLRAPFPPEQIGKLPRAGTQLDYVGHAAVTDRLLEVDPEWSWMPVAWDDQGHPRITQRGNDAVLWIQLTVAGVTRIGVGIVRSDAFELEKQLISDALRNAAMRFGVALDLWTKEQLGHDEPQPAARPRVMDGWRDPEEQDEAHAVFAQLARQQPPAVQDEIKLWRKAQDYTWPMRKADLEHTTRQLTHLAELCAAGLPPFESHQDAGEPLTMTLAGDEACPTCSEAITDSNWRVKEGCRSCEPI